MDLYALLGLTRDATLADVERAYRRLARRYHPGVNPGDPVAERIYRQVQEAYEILADAERRREYDRGGRREPAARIEASVSFQGFDFSAPVEGPLAATFSELFADVFQDAAREATTPTRGADLEMSARVSFVDAARGAAVPMSLTRRERCPACLGDGRVPRPPVVCPACRGEGSQQWTRGHMVFRKPCERCGGDGRVSVEPCRACAASGTAPRTQVVTIVVPPGVEDGARIAVPGHGDAGARGGPAGDLYVTMSVADHPCFERRGRDLALTLPIAVHEAALGADVDVPTLDGRARLRIPAGVCGGEKLRLRGKGLPSPGGADALPAGDLLVTVQIVLPPDLDDRSRALLREFGQRNPSDVRQGLFESM